MSGGLWAALLLPLICGALSTLAYHPVDQGWLIVLTPVPWLLSLAEPRARWVGWSGLAFGVGFLGVGLWWITHVTTVGYAIAVLAMGAWFAPMALLTSAARRRLRLPLTLVLPACWVACELVRAHFIGGFIWFFSGHAMWRYPLAQVADLGGVWLLSAMLAATSGALAELWLARVRPESSLPRAGWQVATCALLLFAADGYGRWRLATSSFEDGPRIGLVQASIPQDVKLERRDITETITEPHITLSEQLLAADPAPELIIWPETMFVGCPFSDPEERDRLGAMARFMGRPMLIGCNRMAPSADDPDDRWRAHNTVALVHPDGRLGAHYDKRRLVQGGEYIPLRDQLPWIQAVVKNMVGYVPDNTAGTEAVRFSLSDDSPGFGVVICNESTFPWLSRQTVAAGARFLVNPTNDGWFKESSELEQVVAICTFRAIENRVGLVRAGNTGISCFIDPDGRVRRRLLVDGKHKNVRGTLVDVVRLDTRVPLARSVGEGVAYLALLVSLLLGLGCWRRGARPPGDEALTAEAA